MWFYLIGAGLAFLLFKDKIMGSGGGAPRSRFVTTGADGVQHVQSAPPVADAFKKEIANYHVRIEGAENLDDGTQLITGILDFDDTDRKRVRVLEAVRAVAGDSSKNATMMFVAEIDKLLTGQRPKSLYIKIAPRGAANEKAKAPSALAIVD